MPCSIAQEIRWAGAIAGYHALECHRDFPDGLSGAAVFFLAGNNVDVIRVAYTDVEVENQSE